MPVVVIDDADRAEALGDALVAAGVVAVEVTLRTGAGLEALRRLARRGDLVVGAGTVLTVEQVNRVVEAGARFVVSPGLDESLVERCLALDVLPLPGIATASELQRAVGLGLSVLKFFPSSLLGGLPALEALAGPFPGVRFFPSGGVDVEEARLLLASPLVLAVGASWLASRADVAAGDSSALAETARAALERLRRPALPPPAPEQRHSGGPIVTLGETLALFHTHGSLAHAGTAEIGIGGAESNVAIALVRLGAAATWIGVLGTDSAGDRVLRELRGEGVDLVVRRDSEAPTAVMLKERPTPTTARVTYHRRGSAGSTLGPGDVPAELVRRASCLHVTGITLALSDSAREAALEAVRLAVAAGVPISFDVNHRPSLWRGRTPPPPTARSRARRRWCSRGRTRRGCWSARTWIRSLSPTASPISARVTRW
ncbi:bifunctional 4-hydroxy-2-oxoglutarate aldolase/2-dehydro-3-deoxy-phosphogluconate aldolase [Rathayibacter oskolensis]|uniref:bifunctional 4-hydroxy-2-oxoglutarate aldolase/2-dehydro-3-deoxy-phosphogluconate aldolase n=1 Tax=Rathayibacter oskolensis TaxID=1891671 RepID=UPI00265F8908|nr:bifunctional 4-hydroxy-2-oxoglutarate aldolase/2-dehydro-3-deoxy-phosphogluconate aldolase [Rathayibacter oskolensis]WKK72237.1 bifunctional 4-hydroxy-2-oxoglutarate aldolase/2-dehydro-3-deoxy-phosphogluconate aldolase [Rathayibacter oskolensis]